MIRRWCFAVKEKTGQAEVSRLVFRDQTIPLARHNVHLQLFEESKIHGVHRVQLVGDNVHLGSGLGELDELVIDSKLFEQGHRVGSNGNRRT